MKKYNINEDKRLHKLPIVLSPELSNKIEDIHWYNRDKEQERNEWKEDILSFLNHLANPVIAWGNHRHYHMDSEDVITMTELGYNVTYQIRTEESTGKNFIFVYKMSLKLYYYGLLEP